MQKSLKHKKPQLNASVPQEWYDFFVSYAQTWNCYYSDIVYRMIELHKDEVPTYEDAVKRATTKGKGKTHSPALDTISREEAQQIKKIIQEWKKKYGDL